MRQKAGYFSLNYKKDSLINDELPIPHNITLPYSHKFHNFILTKTYSLAISGIIY